MSRLLSYLWNTQPEEKDPGFTVAVAESVTAGALANTLCSEPGASEYFKGGVVAYSILSKKEILGVDTEYAEKNNFANPFTTCEMAKAAAKMFNARIGIATTGYSLPTQRDEEPGKCALDIKVPYAYICLYDSKSDAQVLKRVTVPYENRMARNINKASMQTKVALEGKKMYLKFKSQYDLKKKTSEEEAKTNQSNDNNTNSGSSDTSNDEKKSA